MVSNSGVTFECEVFGFGYQYGEPVGQVLTGVQGVGEVDGVYVVAMAHRGDNGVSGSGGEYLEATGIAHNNLDNGIGLGGGLGGWYGGFGHGASSVERFSAMQSSVMARQGMRVESKECMVGYRWGLGGESRLDRRTTLQTDKAWHGMQPFIIVDKDVAGMGAWHNADWDGEAWQDEG
jgi:hypothetical protein